MPYKCSRDRNIITPADVQFVLRFSVVHSSIANNFNPLLFAFVNDSFPLKFTNGHKRRVAPTTQSTALFLFLSCFSLYLPSRLCSFSVILAWNMISRNVKNDNHRARRNNSTRSLERLWEKEQRHTVTLRSYLLIFILRRVSSLRDSSSNRKPCAQYFAFLTDSLVRRTECPRRMSLDWSCAPPAFAIPGRCALIANPIRAVWTETRWQIDSSSVQRLPEMQLKVYRFETVN